MMKEKIKITDPVFSIKNKMFRITWAIFYYLFFRSSPIPLFSYRSIILKLFGADVCLSSRVYPDVSIWDPRNLSLGKMSTLGPRVIVYNQGFITLKDFVTVSQGSHLCASTHNYDDPRHLLVLKPILIENHVWVCADVFVGPGVCLAEGTVVGARAAIFKDTEAWSVYLGNPAHLIKKREIFSNGEC